MALPNLTVQQLEYLVAAVDEPTWAEAAGAVGVTPSALSQGIAELERRLGVELFERHGRRKILADAAAPVLTHARTVLAGTRDLERWATRRRTGAGGMLRVGMIDATAVHHYPDQLRRFRAQRPDIDLRLRVAPSGELLDLLLAGSLDAVVGVEPAVLPDGVTIDRLHREPLAVYAPPGAPVARDASAWGPWVAFPSGSHTRQVIARGLADLGNRYDVVAESHQPEVLAEMVRLGLGWAVLPTSQAESGDRPLTPARRAPLTHRQIMWARRSNALHDPLADLLRTTLKSG